jgi:hypothetical protein
MSPITATIASATTMSTRGIVIRHLTPSSPSVERASHDDLEVIAEPIELAQMPFDGKAFVVRQELVKSHARPLAPHRAACGQDRIK